MAKRELTLSEDFKRAKIIQNTIKVNDYLKVEKGTNTIKNCVPDQTDPQKKTYFFRKPKFGLHKKAQKSQKSSNQNTGEQIMAIIYKLVYFVSTSVGICCHTLYSIECVLDTGTQLNLVGSAFMPEHWTALRQAAEILHHCSAFKDSIKIIVEAGFHVHIGNSLAQATLHIVDKLTGEFLLGTNFIDENILEILSQSKMIVPL